MAENKKIQSVDTKQSSQTFFDHCLEAVEAQLHLLEIAPEIAKAKIIDVTDLYKIEYIENNEIFNRLITALFIRLKELIKQKETYFARHLIDAIYTFVGLKPAVSLYFEGIPNLMSETDSILSLELLRMMQIVNPAIKFAFTNRDLTIVNTHPISNLNPWKYFKADCVDRDFGAHTNLLDAVELAFQKINDPSIGYICAQYLSYLLGYGPTYHNYFYRTKRMPEGDLALVFSSLHYVEMGYRGSIQENEQRYRDYMFQKRQIYQGQKVYSDPDQHEIFYSDALSNLGTDFVYSKQDIETPYLRNVSLEKRKLLEAFQLQKVPA